MRSPLGGISLAIAFVVGTGYLTFWLAKQDGLRVQATRSTDSSQPAKSQGIPPEDEPLPSEHTQAHPGKHQHIEHPDHPLHETHFERESVQREEEKLRKKKTLTAAEAARSNALNRWGPMNKDPFATTMDKPRPIRLVRPTIPDKPPPRPPKAPSLPSPAHRRGSRK